MAHSKYLRWLDEEGLTTKIAKRFVAFCDEDVEQRTRAENFDASIYEDAMKLVINHFEGKVAAETGDDNR
ncbi:MAG: hypothetical protein V3U84_11575 [Thiotrichaceae bacterium]